MIKGTWTVTIGIKVRLIRLEREPEIPSCRPLQRVEELFYTENFYIL